MTARCLLGALAGWALAWATDARAADLPQLQRADGWVVTEFYQHPEKFNRAWRDLSEPYRTKKLCEDMARLFVGAADGSRIRCTPINDVRMVWR